MRALAEFVMRGRAQAILVAVLGIALPFFVWISAAVVALVVLRRGGVDAVIVFGWTALAALGVLLMAGDPGPGIALLAAALAALTLRWSRSWPLALVATVATGLLAALLLNTLGVSLMQHVAMGFKKLLEEMQRQLAPEQVQILTAMVPQQVSEISGFFGLRAALTAVTALLLARWWQALLYNPGGFREEFHRLRLPLPLAAGLIGTGLLIALFGPEYRVWWSMLVALPFAIAGFALVHGVAALKGWGKGPLITLYLSWIVLMQLVTATLLVLALIDCWWDFRGRLRARMH